MWFAQPPKYEGPAQPARCETQQDSLTRWVVSVIGALVPSTPVYDTAPIRPDDDDGAQASPSSVGTAPNGGGKESADPMQHVTHLLRALFGPSK